MDWPDDWLGIDNSAMIRPADIAGHTLRANDRVFVFIVGPCGLISDIDRIEKIKFKLKENAGSAEANGRFEESIRIVPISLAIRTIYCCREQSRRRSSSAAVRLGEAA